MRKQSDLLPRRLVSRDEGRGVSARDIRSDSLSGYNLSQAQPDNDLHLCVRGGNRQHGTRAKHVARVKGRTENTLLEMPFKAVFLFRPAYIQPLHGIRTKTRWYGAAYALMRPLNPLLKMLFPNYVTTTECVGRAMLNVTKRGFPKPVLENRDINRMCTTEA